MKKTLLVLFLLLFTVKLFAQQFSQYNTGTLYDSFENPSQKAFITDTSKMYAFNFFFPNFNANFQLTGNSQASLKSRLFLNTYNSNALTIDEGKYNHVNGNANVYWAMFKMFLTVDGDEEIGFTAQTRAEGKGLFSDETIAILNGPGRFSTFQTYNAIFNDSYKYQTYDQFSLTYREKFNKVFAFGIKLNILSGVQNQQLTINRSNAKFDKALDTVGLKLQGVYHASYIPGKLDGRDFLPIFRNPGVSVSIGTSYKTEDNFLLQANIKDLGFIHWSSRSRVYNFNSHFVIQGLSTAAREDSIYNRLNNAIHAGGANVQSYNTPVDGLAEISAMHSYWIDEDHTFKYSPTLIASKELFYNGFTAALVNPVQYKNYIITLTPTYDELKVFNLGLQLMYKTPNSEFFIGSDKLTRTTSFASEGIGQNPNTIALPTSATGANFFIGFSLKLGPVIEHPMNASTIPTGEKGFIGRLWARIFKTESN